MKRRKLLVSLVALPALSLGACFRDTYRSPYPYGSAADHLKVDIATTVARLNTVVPNYDRLLDRALGLLVFPAIAVLDPVIGELTPARGGRGALQVANVTVGYYRLRWVPEVMAVQEHRLRSLSCYFTQLDALNAFRSRDATTVRQVAESGTVVLLEGMDGNLIPEPLPGRFDIMRVSF